MVDTFERTSTSHNGMKQQPAYSCQLDGTSTWFIAKQNIVFLSLNNQTKKKKDSS